MEKIALISGNGNLPLIFYEEANKNYDIYPIGLFKSVNSKLKKKEKYIMLNLGEIEKIIDYLKKNDIKKVIMLGKVEKSIIYKKQFLDGTMKKIISKMEDRKDETLLLGIISYLKSLNIEVLNQTFFLEKFLAEEKIYTSLKPDNIDLKTIKIGLESSKMLGKIDVGQTVAVKNMAVVALEAIEGTDETIKRAKKYAGDGIILVKMARPQQDMRMDVPVVGLKTIQNLVKAKAKGLVIEAEKVIFIDKEKCIEIANKNNMFIMGVKL